MVLLKYPVVFKFKLVNVGVKVLENITLFPVIYDESVIPFKQYQFGAFGEQFRFKKIEVLK